MSKSYTNVSEMLREMADEEEKIDGGDLEYAQNLREFAQNIEDGKAKMFDEDFIEQNRQDYLAGKSISATEMMKQLEEQIEAESKLIKQMSPVEIRREWMTMLGLSKDEIDEHCMIDGILEEELAELAVVKKWKSISDKYELGESDV